MSLLEVRQKKHGLSEAELRENLRSHLRSAGHLSSLTAQLRHRVVKDFELLSSSKSKTSSSSMSLAHRVRWSVMAEAMKCSGLHHSLSVFVPECGLGNMQNVLSRSEAAGYLGFERQARDTVRCLLDVLLEFKSTTKESAGTQTLTEEEDEGKKSLGEQLRRIREEYEASARRNRPSKSSSMEAWSRECEERYERRLAAEIRTIREVEVARLRRDLEARHRDELDAVAAGARAELAAREKAFRDREAWQEAKRSDQIRLAQEAAAIERRELAAKLAEVSERDATQKRLIEHERHALALLQARLEQQQAEINAALHRQNTGGGEVSRSTQLVEGTFREGEAPRLATPQRQAPSTPEKQQSARSFLIEAGTDQAAASSPAPRRRLSEKSARSHSTRRRSRSLGRERKDSEDDETRQLRRENDELRQMVDDERAENDVLRGQSAGLQSLAAQARAAFDALATLPSTAFSAPDILQRAIQDDTTGNIQAAIDALGLRSPTTDFGRREDDDDGERTIRSIRKLLRREDEENREAAVIERRKRELDQQEREHRDRLEREKQLLADRQRIIDERERRALEDRAFNSSRELETQRKLFETMLQQQAIAVPNQQLVVVAESPTQQRHPVVVAAAAAKSEPHEQHQEQSVIQQAVEPRSIPREKDRGPVAAEAKPAPPKVTDVEQERQPSPKETRNISNVEQQRQPSPKGKERSVATTEREPRQQEEEPKTGVEKKEAASLREEEVCTTDLPEVTLPATTPAPAPPSSSASVQEEEPVVEEGHPRVEDIRSEKEEEEEEEGVEESKRLVDEPVRIDELTTEEADEVQSKDARGLTSARDKFDDHQLSLFAGAFESCAKNNVLDSKGLRDSLHKLSGKIPEGDDLIQENIEGFADFVALLADLDPSLYRPPPELDASAIFDLKLKEISRRNSPLKSSPAAFNRPSTAPANLQRDEPFYDSIDPNVFVPGDQDDDSDWSFG